MTTGATDAVLALECVAIIALLLQTLAADRWKTKLWCWFFGLLAFSSLLGALAHGLDMPDSVRAALWKLLYLCLGILMALLIVGAVADWRGQAVAKRLVPASVITGAAFFGLTELLSGAFTVFIAYEAVALVSALAIYIFLAVTQRRKGAYVVAMGIVFSMVAAGLQASHISFDVVLAFDHNGAFHLAQMLSTAVLALGLHVGIESDK